MLLFRTTFLTKAAKKSKDICILHDGFIFHLHQDSDYYCRGVDVVETSRAGSKDPNTPT